MSVQAMTSSVSGTYCRAAASGSVTRAFTAAPTRPSVPGLSSAQLWGTVSGFEKVSSTRSPARTSSRRGMKERFGPTVTSTRAVTSWAGVAKGLGFVLRARAVSAMSGCGRSGSVRSSAPGIGPSRRLTVMTRSCSTPAAVATRRWS